MAVQIFPGLVSSVGTASQPTAVIPAGISGGKITNPLTAADQNIAGPAQVLYVNAVANATLNGNTTTFALQPGESWDIIPGQTTVTTVNSNVGGHSFSAIYW